MVDSSKPSMIDDIVEDLTSLVTDRDLLGLPLLVLANKQDSEGAVKFFFIFILVVTGHINILPVTVIIRQYNKFTFFFPIQL